MKQIRVMLIEGDPYWQQKIGDLIRATNDLCLLATFDNKDDAIKFVQSNEIEVAQAVILLSDGLNAVPELCAMGKVKVVIIASHPDENIVAEVFAYGAANFVAKEHYRDIPELIRAVAKGESLIHHCASRGVLKELIRLKREERARLLSNSEKEILRLIHNGLTYSQIQSKLHITERTVKNHVNRILKKMKVRSGKEAAHQAKLRGMI